MPEREPPEPKTIEFKQLKAADRSDFGDGLHAGDTVVCKVTQAEPGGYAVFLPDHELPGFLPTQRLLQPDEELSVRYVCMHKCRALLSMLS